MSAALELSNVTVSLDGRVVVRGATLRAEPGALIGLIGPNGAGKSTLLRAAAGLIPIERGGVHINGVSLSSLSPIERARALAYLPQARPIYWSLPVRSIVALGRFAYGTGGVAAGADAEAIDTAMAETGVLGFADRPASRLSGGELARVHLARALAAQTKIIFADEPIAALDPAHQLGVMALLRRKADDGALVIAALHDLALAARYCTRLVVLHEGRIAADGAPIDVLSPDILRSVFHVGAAIDNTAGHFSLRLEPLAP